MKYSHGCGAAVFQWGTDPCYSEPYWQTNVPAGIDGLEFA